MYGHNSTRARSATGSLAAIFLAMRSSLALHRRGSRCKRLRVTVVQAVALAMLSGPVFGARAADWSISGTILTPSGIITDSALSISNGAITAVGPTGALPNPSSAIKVPGIILPGFIDLHNHLTWNVLPRWVPSRKFNNRYEWQDTPEYDRLLVEPHNVVLNAAACESEIYAEIKAIAGGATSVVGSLLPTQDHPDNTKCAAGLARNLDLASGLPFTPPDKSDLCETKAGAYEKLLDVVDNEVFPLELTHPRFDFLLCELGTGALRSLIIHLSEGTNTDSSAHREFTMLDKAGLLQPGLVIVHGTAIRGQDFLDMAKNKVGLVWSPRSNDELYGSTTDIAAALADSIPIAIAPDWNPSGSAGMLQELSYAARRYPAIRSADLLAMATSTPAKIARLDNQIGALTPGRLADFIVIDAAVDPQAPRPLDPVVNSTPANIALVVIGGQPLYGDPSALAQLLPAGAKLDPITVCGSKKAIYLGQSEAAARNESFADITNLLNTALASAGSSLPNIECD
jgi:5-methylthioadenosine/S-adenosylhomocysteine deaminase